MAVCGSSHHGNPDGVQGSGIMGGGLRLVVVREGESVRQEQEGFPCIRVAVLKSTLHFHDTL